MIGVVLSVYTDILEHYQKKWHDEKIDRKYQRWEEGLDMREDLGFEDRNFQRIPKRKIKNNAQRKRHNGRNA